MKTLAAILLCALMGTIGASAQETVTNQTDVLSLKIEKLERDSVQRIQQLEQRIARLEQRLNNVVGLLGDNFENGSRFDTVDRRLREIERKVDRLDRR